MRIVRMPSSNEAASSGSSSASQPSLHRQQSSWLPANVVLPWPTAKDFNRIELWWQNIPLGTRVILGLCTVATLCCNTHRACLGVSNVIPTATSFTMLDGVWSFAASTWVHQGVLHWLMNSLAMLAIGSDMELAMGTSSFGWLVVLLVGLVNTSFLAFEYLFAHWLHWLSSTCGVGLSGVLFALMTFEAWDGMHGYGQFGGGALHASGQQHRETLLFGVVAVRTKLAPFLLLLIIAILFPASSFVMHAAGVVVGLGVASVSQTNAFLRATGACGRDSFCSRCRHFEDAPVVAGRRVDVAAGEGQASSASMGGGNNNSVFVLPIAAVPKGFEAFQTPGRRLGDSRPVAPTAPPASAMLAEDVV